MAFTIEQLQAFSNTKPELRSITEQIIDYLQNNQSNNSDSTIIAKTVAEMQMLAGSFAVGQLYNITDAAQGTCSLYIIAVSDDSLAASGQGIYKNSIMQDSVSCTVWYVLADDVITRIFEPFCNNDVRVSDSDATSNDFIGAYPFDKPNWVNNNLNSCKLLNIDYDTSIISGSTLETMVINGNNHTGLSLINHTQKGMYGNLTPNDAEIFISGDSVYMEGNIAGTGALPDDDCPSYFDSLGTNSYILINTFLQYASLNANGYTIQYFVDNILEQGAEINCNNDGLNITACRIANEATIQHYTGGLMVGTRVDANSVVYLNKQMNSCRIAAKSTVTLDNGDMIYTSIGEHSEVSTTGGNIADSLIGNNCTYTSGSAVADKNIQNIAGITYELGVTSGAVTATAV